MTPHPKKVVAIDAEMHAEVRQLAARKRVKMFTIVEAALTKHLDDIKNQADKEPFEQE